MKKFKYLIGAGVLMGGFTLNASYAADVTLRFHHFLPPKAPAVTKMFASWKDKIHKQSNGRIKIQEFPAMQLGGKAPDLVNQVVDGTVDIIWTLQGYTAGRFPKTEVFDLPFMLSNAEATSRALYQLSTEKMQDEYSSVHVLGLAVHGPGNIHSKKAIGKMSDLRGMKLRAPTRITGKLLKELGATPVGMPVPSVPSSLSKGVIDGAILPWDITAALKVPELVKSHTVFEGGALYTTTFLMAMNKNSYNKLPADLKKVIDNNSGLDFSGWLGKNVTAYDDAIYGKVKSGKNKVIIISGSELQKWKDKASSVTTAWVKDMDGKGKDGTGLLKRAKQLISENTK